MKDGHQHDRQGPQNIKTIDPVGAKIKFEKTYKSHHFTRDMRQQLKHDGGNSFSPIMVFRQF